MKTRIQSDFLHDGYVIIPNFIDKIQCDELIQQAEKIVVENLPTTPKIIFSSRTEAHQNEKYFQESGDKIRCFFEDAAFDESGSLRVHADKAINKIGHALHDLDPVFDRFSRQVKIQILVRSLGLHDPKLLTSMIIFKYPHIGGEVLPHQDATFLYSEPQSLIGLWFALDDADEENGCLWVLPGGHEWGLKYRHYRRADGLVVTDEVNPAIDWAEEKYIPAPVSKGSVVVMHGLLPHKSGPNLSPKRRCGYALHLYDGCSNYPENNWLQRDRTFPFRGFV